MISFGGWLGALMLLLVGGAGQAAAQSFHTTSSLSGAYANLAQAKPIYKGHRVRAMGHIKTAARLSGGKISVRSPALEVHGDSDAKLRAAQGMLNHSRAGLSGKSLKHVNLAMEELSAALNGR